MGAPLSTVLYCAAIRRKSISDHMYVSTTVFAVFGMGLGELWPFFTPKALSSHLLFADWYRKAFPPFRTARNCSHCGGRLRPHNQLVERARRRACSVIAMFFFARRPLAVLSPFLAVLFSGSFFVALRLSHALLVESRSPGKGVGSGGA